MATPRISMHLALYVAVPGTPPARGSAHIRVVSVAGSTVTFTSFASAEGAPSDSATATAAERDATRFRLPRGTRPRRGSAGRTRRASRSALGAPSAGATDIAARRDMLAVLWASGGVRRHHQAF